MIDWKDCNVTQHILEIFSLRQARRELNKYIELHQHEQVEIVLTNAPGTIYYLGVKVIDNMFKLLRNEFNVKSIILNVEDDHAAAISALKLGYTNIVYNGNSEQMKKLLGYNL